MKSPVERGEFRAKTERAAKSASLAQSVIVAWRPPSQEEQDRRAVPVLKRAWALVSAGWCQHVAFRQRDGSPVVEQRDVATHFSLVGAVRASADPGLWIEAEYALRAVRRYLKAIDLVRWNDEPLRTKRQVLAAIHGTIDMLLKEQRTAGGWRVTSGPRPAPRLPALQLSLPLEDEGGSK